MTVTKFLRSFRAIRASFIPLAFDSALAAGATERDSTVLEVEVEVAADSTSPFILCWERYVLSFELLYTMRRGDHAVSAVDMSCYNLWLRVLSAHRFLAQVG